MNNFYGMPQQQIQGYGNPYYSNQVQPRQVEQFPQYGQPQQNVYNKPVASLQGKLAESIDVIKATEISLDGSVNYFPLIDGTAIITKQLQADGTIKMTVYKPSEEEKPIQQNYVTSEQLSEALTALNIKDYSEDIQKLSKKIDDLSKKFEKGKEK